LATVDAAQLGPHRLKGSSLILRRTKTGTNVTVLLPDVVVERLNALSVFPSGYWFWNRQGASKHETAVGNMRRQLRPIFREAKVYMKDIDGKVMLDADGKQRFGHPYQWRHTFVNELILKSATFPQIADLLGNKASTVEETYAHFVPGRQKPLDETVQKGWNLKELESFRL